MIKLVGINKIYRTNEIETVALEDVNLTVNKGEFLSIMGPSGCGKSTLLNIMGLLDTPTGGSIEVAGTRIESMKDKDPYLSCFQFLFRLLLYFHRLVYPIAP